PARLVERCAAGLGLDLGDLPCRSRQGPELRVACQLAGEELKRVGHGAGFGLALVERLLTLLVPRTVAALDRVGGVAELLGLLAVRGRSLLQGVELRLQRLAICTAPPGVQ